MKIIIKRVGKEPKLEQVNNRYRCELKDMINADILETVKLSEDGLFQMWVDEDGLPRQLDVNFLMAMSNPHYPIQLIVGDVIFVRIKKPDYTKELYDYEIDDIAMADLQLMYRLISPEYQHELYLEFKKTNKY